MKSVKDADIDGKRIIVWTTLNVPIESGKIADDTKLKASLETINFLREKAASVLLIGHLGRPKEKDPSLTLKPVAKKLGEFLSTKIELLEEIKPPVSSLAMLENIRFWPGEEARDKKFAKEIASLGDLYVNDCFSTSHHAGATMVYLPKFLPSYAGLNLLRETKELKNILESPNRPLVSIVGGAKLETKLPVIDNLARVSNNVLIGGKLMFEVNIAYLSENVVVAHDDIDKKDIGPKAVRMFKEIIGEAKTIVWNGPMGIFEDEKYVLGTKEIAEAIIHSNAYSVAGGGDTIEALNNLGLLGKIDYVSNGGGAMLKFLAGEELLGITALEESIDEK